MNRALILGLGTVLLAAMPASATPGWDEPSKSAMPQAELSYGAIPAPSPAARQEALASARRPTPNGPGNVIPNGTPTASPPGAGASSQATLTEHGEQATAAASNNAGTLSTR
jgi:hypothetical protein